MEDCWIDPKGKIHEVLDCGHNDFAIEMLQQEMGMDEYLEYFHGINRI